MRQPFFLVVFLCSFAAACATGANRIEAGPFPDTYNEAADVSAVLQAASASDHLALIVLGANWCHDSKALVAALDDPLAKTVIEAHFETVLINVGNFERGFTTAQRFGLPIYMHTPTLLIVDPETGKVVNWDDHYIFRDAYQLSAEEVADYLTAHSSPENGVPQPTEGREAIDAWAAQTAARIRVGYQKIGAYEDFDGEEFLADWKALKPLRYNFSEDYPAALLRLQEAGEAGELPSYEALPWE
ncbi:hypothetical protein [Parvularcula marina]|uniref:Thioredoxin family protein n=1 Tax=Parvularcula marina TaxID=2292771 RepID=A0A371RH18_9PROT|nr:hypothetical protein [Parvularcula marina]RFB04751.1 hypothetical protein DX908_05330 [Parvularcula marina]